MRNAMLFGWMLAASPLAAHGLEIVNGAGGLEITGKGAVAVFRPSAREVWVVAPGEGRGEISARNGWLVEWLQTEGAGVRVVSPAARDWQVARRPDGTFAVRVGKPEKQVVVARDSLILLKDGSVVGDKGVAVASADGRRYFANPAGAWAAGPGVGEVLAGGVVGLPDNLALGLANIEPASGGGDVPLHEAAALPKVDSPVGGMAAHGEDLKALGAVEGVVYTPGELLTFTLPEGFKLVDGQVVRVPAKEGLQAIMAVDEAASTVADIDKKAAVKVAPKPVAEEHKVPEVVAEEHHSAEEAHGEVAHGAGEVSSTAHGEEVAHAEPADSVPEGAVTPGWLPEPLSRLAFKPAEIALQHEIVNAADESQRMAKRRELAKFYLVNKRPEEALGVLGMIEARQPLDDLLEGTARVVQGRGVEAEKVLDGIEKGLWRGHAQLWRATALAESGNYGEALKAWPSEKGLVGQYPAWMRDIVLLGRATALWEVGSKADARAFVAGVVEELDDPSPAWQRLEALTLLDTQEDRRGLEQLAAVAEQTRDPMTAYKAKYDFLNVLLARNDIEPRQMVAYLESLRMEWRGDNLEERVLRDLGRLYVRRDDYREGLQRWQTLVRAYPQYPGMAQLTREMTSAVVGAFDPENPVGYSPLEFMGLFFDFRELLPNDQRGDRITERVGQLLSEATLYERSIPLMENLLRYREQEAPIDRARIALLLARAYRLNGSPQESLKLLDSYDKDVVNVALREAWQVERGQTFVALERYDQAIAAVSGLDKLQADQVRLDAAWGQQDWLGITKAADGVLNEPLLDKQSQMFKVALLRSAFANLMLGQGDKIAALKTAFAEPLAKMPEVADSLRAMAGMQGMEMAAMGSEGALGRFANALADINKLALDMQAIHRAQEAAKEDQQDYNQKMEYMELLPPPSL